MTNWNDYKKYVKETDPNCKADLEEVEAVAKVISAIVAKRTEMGISQRDLAALCNVPQSSVARIESFKTTPKLDTIIKIMSPLGLHLTVTG